MSENGWVKVYRKIMDKGYYKKSQYVHLWLHLLLKASHEETEFMWNGKIEKLEPGQFVTGRKKLSSDTGIAPSTVEDILSLFETEQQIRQQKNNKFRLLTVLNWEDYQLKQQQIRQQSNNKATTKQQPADTFKNIKNERIKEKDIDVLAKHISETLKITMSDKGQTEQLIKIHGLETMIGCVDRMAIYFKEVKENKWTRYVIGKHWRNLYEKIDNFISMDNLNEKLSATASSNYHTAIKVDCRTVSTDFSSDEEIMNKQRSGQ